MRQYILRRLLLMIPVLLGTTVLIFATIRIVPGDVLMSQFSEAQTGTLTPQMRELLLHELGLDVPVHEQYLTWLGGLVRGDLGNSLTSRNPVGPELARRVPVSAELAVFAVLFAVLFGITSGVISALRQDSWVDHVARLVSIVWLSVPSFVVAILIVMLPAIWFRYAPPLSFVSLFDDPAKNLQKYLPAAIALGAVLSGSITRMTRSSMLEVLRDDYIRTARAKGLQERLVVTRHALKNGLVPVLTLIGDQFAHLLGGTVIVETVFNLPGLGTMAVRALHDRDYTTIQAVTLFYAAVFIMVNLAVDLAYAWLNPRIRYA
ncbi:MAG: ABC transporter permease [Chloroflexota bacterium]